MKPSREKLFLLSLIRDSFIKKKDTFSDSEVLNVVESIAEEMIKIIDLPTTNEYKLQSAIVFIDLLSKARFNLFYQLKKY